MSKSLRYFRPTLSKNWIVGLLFSSLSCTHFKPHTSKGDRKDPEPSSIRWNHSKDEISILCEEAKGELEDAIADFLSGKGVQQADLQKDLGHDLDLFDKILTTFQDRVDPLSFYSNVSTNPEIREISKKCSEDSQKRMLEVFTQEALYKKWKALDLKKEGLSDIQKKILEELILEFELNGLALKEEDRAKLKSMNEKMITLGSDFSQTLVDWDKKFDFSKKELEGMPEGILSGLDKSKAPGKDYVLTLKYPHYYPAMKYVHNAEIRKKLFQDFFLRGGEPNKNRLSEALELRRQIAHMLGYKSHAELQLKRKMAKSPEKVSKFLTDLQKRLQKRGKKEFEVLLGLKRKKEKLQKNQKWVLDPWDVAYYENTLLETRYKIDHEEIKAYFPLDHVLKEMFEVYQTLLGVQFVENVVKTDETKAQEKAEGVWDPEVRSFGIVDNASKKLVGKFYIDLFPRDGKYGHAAAFTLLRGYQKGDGTYAVPVSSIVANFNKPQEHKPSLLDHAEVETLFHEFGHIMHQTLTKAHFGYFSGTSVKRDFVEAPSQMLENWVWKEDILTKLSSHYQTQQKLPKKIMNRMLEAKNVDKGIFYLRQIFYASIDMAYHTLDQSPLTDTTALYQKLYSEIYMLQALPGIMPEASFGHIMGGYDAGYYGYLWSDVYAADMFTRFEKDGLLNPKTGADYRKWILEPGGEKDPMELLVGFLGRQPSNKAFLKNFQ
ncbi:MAG: Zn-dependent oligopeptidase [Oligoflexales bacterium]|nr:Zn-dependent oligopeptidase [Oligoflexales bacterium]